MRAFKIVALLLTGLGLAGVSCRLATGKCPFGHLKAAAKRAWARFHEQEPNDRVFVKQAEDEPVRGAGEEHRGGEQWQHLVAARQRAGDCHRHCGEDKECHDKCPRPWQHFKDKCETMKPIFSCHKSCGFDQSCHMQCPKPQCPRMHAMVDKALECHSACKPDDFACHKACPWPLLRMAWGCRKLAMKAECHQACGPHDHHCHHQCHHQHFGDHHGHHFGDHHGHHFGRHHGHHFGHHSGHHHGRDPSQPQVQWEEAKGTEEGPFAVAEAVDPTLFVTAEATVVQV